MIYIYGLHVIGEPVTDIRYVGQSATPSSRLSNHRSDKSDTAKVQWITTVRQAGQDIGMIILDTAQTKDLASAKENAWIIFGRKLGWQLVNGTNPGDHRDFISGEMSIAESALAYANNLAEQVKQMTDDVQVLSMQLDESISSEAVATVAASWEHRKLSKYKRIVSLESVNLRIRLSMFGTYLSVLAMSILGFCIYISVRTMSITEMRDTVILFMTLLSLAIMIVPFCEVFKPYATSMLKGALRLKRNIHDAPRILKIHYCNQLTERTNNQ